jgi:hypothetical protein
MIRQFPAQHCRNRLQNERNQGPRLLDMCPQVMLRPSAGYKISTKLEADPAFNLWLPKVGDGVSQFAWW